MDYRSKQPEKQEGKTLCSNKISAFGFSLQGASHTNKQPSVPCQDYSDLIYLEEEDLLIAAIADGVGSCLLSHWGAYVAVRSALDSAKKALQSRGTRRKIILDAGKNEEMKKVLSGAFEAARDAVEKLADEAGELVFQFQSTLTLAVYDGENLLFGHVGDDGIVVQTTDGNVEMLTARQKGEEASSVYPLQSGERVWSFGRSAKPVAAFIMATDGVLDAFVANRPDYYGVNYCKGVYYPFMEKAVYTLGENDNDAPQRAMNYYLDYMNSENYRSQVTDDLTMVAVVSKAQLAVSNRPRFSMKIWDTVQEESTAARKLLLNHKPLPDMSGDRVLNMRTETKCDKREEHEAAVKTAPGEFRQRQAVEGERKARRNPWCTAVLIFLLIAASATGGFAAGRWLFPEIAPDELRSVSQQRDELSQKMEALTKENQMLEKSNQELSGGLEQAEAAQALVSTQLESQMQEAEALQKQVEDLQKQVEDLERQLEEPLEQVEK